MALLKEQIASSLYEPEVIDLNSACFLSFSMHFVYSHESLI